ncbi:MAG: crossover junction endodeoxyribonuclease RuvC [Patescibacteria group bacterium]|nr:crossover junction endodeoxyribonuclease RuvC [Patescibacteria group bacterium]
MRVLGIDPGYDRLGAAIIEREGGKEAVLFSTCLITNKKDDLPERYLYLGKELKKLIKKYQPNTLAIEKLFFTNNKKTASQVSEVRGMIIYLAADQGLNIFEYTPLEIKTTVAGFGQADKKQVADMVKQLVHLDEIRRHDDEYDAIAVALTALARERF